MVVIFDFRASRHGKTKPSKKTFNTVNGTRVRLMQTAVLNTAPRQGDIDGFSAVTGVKRCAFQLPAYARVNRCTRSFAALRLPWLPDFRRQIA